MQQPKVTHERLRQLYYLNREIESDRRRITELRHAATNTGASISGLPHAKKISDKTALAGLIADCEKTLQHKLHRCVREYDDLNRFVASIDDSLMRQIISYRHINGLSWRQVAFHIGGGNTEDGVRMQYKRFLERQ